VASLYSLPLTVLKSSAKATDAKHSTKNVRTFVLMYWLDLRPRFSSDILELLGQGETARELERLISLDCH